MYFCATDESINGRIGFIDVSADDPSVVLYEHPEPVLNAGADGAFDSSGVAPSCYLIDRERRWLYTIGFQRCEKIGVLLFAGLVQENGAEFSRVSKAPIFPRIAHRPLMQGAPCVIRENGAYRMWHWYVSEWRHSAVKYYSVYHIGHARSADGVTWEMDDITCLSPKDGEIGIARPWVVKSSNKYEMWFSVRRLTEDGIPLYTGIGRWAKLGA